MKGISALVDGSVLVSGDLTERHHDQSGSRVPQRKFVFSPRDKPRQPALSTLSSIRNQHDATSSLRVSLSRLDESVLCCVLESVLVTSVVIVENIYKERNPCMCGV